MPDTYYLGDKEIYALSKEERAKLISAFLRKDYDSLPDYTVVYEDGSEGVARKDGIKDYTASLLELLTLKSNTEFVDEQEVIEILRSTIRSIPDSEVSVEEKYAFLKTYFAYYHPKLTDISYDESLEALSKPKMKTSITLSEYQAAFKSERNYSDYIVLSVGLLRTLSKDNADFNKLIDGIEKEYFEYDYEKCLKMISDICEAINKKEQVKKDEAELPDQKEAAAALLAAQKKCYEVDPNHNDTKRFFGTKLSQYILGQFTSKSLKEKDEMLKSIDTISMRILKKKVSTPEDVEEAIASIAESGGEGLHERHLQLKDEAPKYQIKDRVLRGQELYETYEDFQARETEAEGTFSKQTIYSMNLGELRSNSPNFRDELTAYAIRNRIVDLNRPDPEMGESGYSATDKRWRASFISSISGHTFYTVAVLEKYMRDYRNPRLSPGERDPDLERDVNRFLVAYVGTYAKRGYHSMHEVLDVLREPNIVKVFKDNGVNLEVSINPTMLHYAMDDALAYSKAVTIRSEAQDELTAKVKVKEMLKMKTADLERELISIEETINNFDNVYYISNRAKVTPYERVLKELIKSHPNLTIKSRIKDILNSIEIVHFIYKVETAFRTKDEATVKRMLSDPIVVRNLNTPSVFGDTLISLAAEAGFNDIVIDLIKKGVKVDDVNLDGKTALIIAAEKGNHTLVSKLMDLNCDVSIKDKKGFTAFMYAASLNHVKTAEVLLKDDEVLAKLHIQTKNGSNLLSKVSGQGFHEMVSLFLENGADPLKVDREGNAAIVYAAKSNHPQVVNVLIEAMKTGDEETVNDQLHRAFMQPFKMPILKSSTS